MKIKVKQGQGVVVATHVGQGDERRMLFITPWGCSLSPMKPAPKGADMASREYEVDATGEVERLIRSALKAEHKGLVGRVSIVEVTK